jgi:hypothetical protein
VSPERGTLNLVSTTEELLGRNSGFDLEKSENMAVGNRRADHMTPFIPKKLILRRQAAVARSV